MNSIKFVHVTDIHIMGRNPVYRKDNFLETTKAKLAWVNKYAFDIGASAILCTGDIFDRADTAYSVLNDVVSIFESSHVPWICIAGNHDIYGYNPETIPRTPYGTLRESRNILTVGSYNNLYFDENVFELANKKILVTGQDSDGFIDKRHSEDKYFDYGYYSEDTRTWYDIIIHLCHGYLTDTDLGSLIEHTKISEICNKINADIVLTGHEHVGFGVVKRNGKLFVNPGALTRTTSGEGDINRDSQIAVIEIFENGEYDANLVKVEIAKPSEEVIDIEKAKEEKDKRRNMENFINDLNEVDISQLDVAERINPMEYIDSLASVVFSNAGVPQNYIDGVKNIAKKSLEEAEQRLGGE